MPTGRSLLALTLAGMASMAAAQAPHFPRTQAHIIHAKAFEQHPGGGAGAQSAPATSHLIGGGNFSVPGYGGIEKYTAVSLGGHGNGPYPPNENNDIPYMNVPGHTYGGQSAKYGDRDFPPIEASASQGVQAGQ